MSTKQIRAIAEAADRFGRGRVQFTSRMTVELPHKFKIAAGGCPNNCVKPAWKVHIGGRWGKKVGQGTPLGKLFTSEEAVLSVAEKTILFYKEKGSPGKRFADTIARLGFENVEREILSDDILARKEDILKD